MIDKLLTNIDPKNVYGYNSVSNPERPGVPYTDLRVDVNIEGKETLNYYAHFSINPRNLLEIAFAWNGYVYEPVESQRKGEKIVLSGRRTEITDMIESLGEKVDHIPEIQLSRYSLARLFKTGMQSLEERNNILERKENIPSSEDQASEAFYDGKAQM